MPVPVFPGPEWIQDYCDRLAAHPDAGSVARTLEGVYRFTVDAGGPLRQRQVHALRIRPVGDGAVVTVADAEAAAQPVLSITAAYPHWRQLIEGKLDLGRALLLRRVKVGGNLTRVTGRLSSAQPLIDALRAVDTVWLEDA